MVVTTRKIMVESSGRGNQINSGQNSLTRKIMVVVVGLDELSSADSHLDNDIALMCPNHSAQTLRFYCRECETAICTTCTDIEHNSHTTMRLQDAVKEQKTSLRMLLDKTYARVPDLSSAVDSINETSSSLQVKYDEATSRITETFEYMIKLLQDRKVNLLNELNEIHSDKQNTLAEQKQVLDNLLINIGNTCDFIEGTLEHGSDTQILLLKKQMGERFSQDFNVQTMPEENNYLVYIDDDITDIKNSLSPLGHVESSSAVSHETTAAGDGLKQCIVGRENIVNVAAKDRRGNLVRVHASLFSAQITNLAVSMITIDTFLILIMYTKACRRDFTDMRRKTEIEEVEEETRKSKLLRSSIVPVNWKSQCFLCGNEATLDTKNPKRRPCHKVTFVEFHKTVLEQCRRRNDTWGNEVYTRLNCSNDLVADEGRYHRMCLLRFMINKRSPDAEVGEKGRPVDEGMQQWFQMLCIWLEVEADAELYTLQELHKKMAEIAGDEDIYGDMISYFLHDLWDKERTRDEDREAEIVVLTADKLIMSEIREKEYDPSVYPK
ncbi:Tripartite motif-containing protein 3 [Nymphon striatum]|nr:Tripartite motif-containing protein 3 [Nymphon striatum]